MTTTLDPRILTQIAALQPPDPPNGLPLPSVSMMFQEMKRVALADVKLPQTDHEQDRLLEFVFHAAYSHALTLQLLLQTQPGTVADRISVLHAAETISHIKKWRTYHDHPVTHLHLEPFEVNGQVVAL